MPDPDVVADPSPSWTQMNLSAPTIYLAKMLPSFFLGDPPSFDILSTHRSLFTVKFPCQNQNDESLCKPQKVLLSAPSGARFSRPGHLNLISFMSRSPIYLSWCQASSPKSVFISSMPETTSLPETSKEVCSRSPLLTSVEGELSSARFESEVVLHLSSPCPRTLWMIYTALLQRRAEGDLMERTLSEVLCHSSYHDSQHQIVDLVHSQPFRRHRNLHHQ
ncbi:unnamed protein product [Protopolystoma xenopodis]|uniref:Uncharacterized protein n=1 Tax=Protopolystoma xenopodis TaxID=117903 RepID=A0A448XE92_9PLAT|nr:unnamed protein product [Protopolystoma xenopodis]